MEKDAYWWFNRVKEKRDKFDGILLHLRALRDVEKGAPVLVRTDSRRIYDYIKMFEPSYPDRVLGFVGLYDGIGGVYDNKDETTLGLRVTKPTLFLSADNIALIKASNGEFPVGPGDQVVVGTDIINKILEADYDKHVSEAYRQLFKK